MLISHVVVCAVLLGQHPAASPLTFDDDAQSLRIGWKGQPLARYVFVDALVPRPYFAFVNSLNGVRLTRSHPPKPDEAQDHVGLHTGVWLAFGDISGNDYWRLKAKVEHAGFVERPRAVDNRLLWSVRNRYLSADGKSAVCEEVCQYTLDVVPTGWRLSIDSRFRFDSEFCFGQQDEMGLGIRVPTALAVKSGQGGRIVDSEGRKNEEEIWGTSADWVDYGGIVDGRRMGLAILSHSGNPYRTWHHARDYGFVAANPFPRDLVKTTVAAGEEFRLRYAVYVYDAPSSDDANVAGVYRSYVQDGE